MDISDHGAVVTQDDRTKSALYFEGGSEFCEMFKTTIRNETAVSKKVAWNSALFKGRPVDASSVDKDTLSAFGVQLGNISNLQQEVAEFLTKKTHRYK